MFCKNCGSNIKDGASFCPKCGQRVGNAPGGPMTYSAPPPIMPGVQADAKPKKSKTWLVVVGAVVALAMIALVVYKVGFTGGSLVGTWYSDDAANVEKIFRKILTDELEISESLTDTVMSMTRVDFLGKLTVSFTDKGSVLIGVSGTSVNIAAITYEETGDNSIMLVCKLDIPVLKDVGSVSIPVKYNVKRNKMTMTLYGYSFDFTRDK